MMRLRNRLTESEFEARLTTEHSASSYGIPVLVDEHGEAIDIFSFAFCEVLEATEEEIQALRAANYPV